MRELWVDKYRPKTINDYVFKDEKQRKKVEKWLESGVLPTILLGGSPGCGKSSLIRMLLSELKVDPYDILEVNASANNGVDYIRDTITRFAETMGVGDMRYVFLDEADYLSMNAQATLRGVIEKYSSSVRFLMTCNSPHKIMHALHSRAEAGRMQIESLNLDEYYEKLIVILSNEGVEVDIDALDAIVNKTYPDLRRGISMIQANSTNGQLESPDDDVENVNDVRLEMITLFRAKRYKEARQLICQKIDKNEYEEIYTFMYQNLDIWGDTDEKQNKAILAIKKGLVDHSICADLEICLSATLVHLELIANDLT